MPNKKFLSKEVPVFRLRVKKLVASRFMALFVFWVSSSGIQN